MATVLIGIFSSAPARADGRAAARAEVAFGIVVAQKGLWREARYHWERATQLDPTYAAAFNDLAVAYEHEALLDKAKDAYEKAVALDPKNQNILQNLELFKELYERQHRPPSQ